MLELNFLTLNPFKCQVSTKITFLYWLIRPVVHLRDSDTTVWCTGYILIGRVELKCT